MLLTSDVSKLERSRVLSEVQPKNMPHISVRFEVSKCERSRVSTIVPENMRCMFLTCEVSKLDVSSEESFEQFTNMSDMSVTLKVSKFFTLMAASDEQPLNMPFMLVTRMVLNRETSSAVSAEQPSNISIMAVAEDVSIPVRSMLVRAEHSANMLFMPCTPEVLKPDRSTVRSFLQPANRPSRLLSPETPGMMRAATMLSTCSCHGEVPSRSASVPLLPDVGRTVSVPSPSMVHVQPPLVPRAISSACAVEAKTGIKATARTSARAALAIRLVSATAFVISCFPSNTYLENLAI